MSIDIARDELAIRRKEDADAEADGTWEFFSRMKRERAYRRKAIGWSRGKMNAWLQVAERSP
jgi:hypothetical protein